MNTLLFHATVNRIGKENIIYASRGGVIRIIHVVNGKGHLTIVTDRVRETQPISKTNTMTFWEHELKFKTLYEVLVPFQMSLWVSLP